MRMLSYQKIIWGGIVLSLVGGLLTAPAVFARDKEVCWGGAGFEPKVRNSCRYLAYIYKTGMEFRIRVDTYETFENLTTLRLIPPQGRECVSRQCKKMSRQVYSPWECSFPATDIIKLSGVGMIIAENQYGQNLVTDDMDFDEIKTLFRMEVEKDPDSRFLEP